MMKFSNVTFMKLVATFAAVAVTIIVNEDLVVSADQKNLLRPRKGAGNINTNIVAVRGQLLPEFRNGSSGGKGKGGGGRKGKKGKKGKESAAPSFSPSLSVAPSVEPSVSTAPSVSSAPSTEPSVSFAPSVSNAPSNDPSIADIACNTPEFSTLCALVIAADLADVLSGPGPFTVFAPTNDAFDALLAELGITLPPDLGSDPALLATIKDILLYHVVVGSVVLKMELKCHGHIDTARDPANGDVDSQTQCLFVGNDEISFFQIGDGTLPLLPPQIVAFDIMATNGVIHVVNNVILPDNLPF